jgi:hypothetical protein
MSENKGWEADFAAAFKGDPEYDIEAFFDQHGMTGVEERALVEVRKDWLERIEQWLDGEDPSDWYMRRLTDEANRLRRQLGIPRPRNLKTIREKTRERVARFRERKKEREQTKKQQPDQTIPGTSRDEKRQGLAIFLKQMVEERRNDFSPAAIAAAMNWPKQYPVELVAELLAELKASGEYDRILAETVPT